MKTIARLACPTALGLVYALSVACAAPAIPNGDGDLSSSRSKKGGDDVDDEGTALPKKTKSDNDASSPLPSPTPSASSSTPTPAPTTPPASTPPTDTKPAKDPMACVNLGNCCQRIENVFGRIACLAVQARGDLDTCSKSLIGCEAANGLGGGSSSGGSSGGTRCYDDFDCPGVQVCMSGTCR